MKNKLLYFFLFINVFHASLFSKSHADTNNTNWSTTGLASWIHPDHLLLPRLKSTFFAPKKVFALLPPTVTGGSSCGPGTVTLTAKVGAGETAEWYTTPTGGSAIFAGTSFTTPLLTTTTTYYVQAKSATDVSTRIPVVAVIKNQPPAVTITANPLNNSTNPICAGTPITFTANGGGDVFEFSVDGVVKQAFSPNKTFTTTTLTNNQVVTVRSRYAVTYDGKISEAAWGTGAFEDNTGSVSLSSNASNGYINSLRITPTEDKLIFGFSGKLVNYRRILIFLDTKAGGYNVSNYGDENTSLPDVRAFNYFNNNPSTFDSYFAADYCLAVATDGGETNYYADVIELKNPNSYKTYLGTAATNAPSSVMGVNKNNTGITDYTNGFEIEVSKALIGYAGNGLKFFAFTMQDNAISNYNVTNSFLSPELDRTTDFGNAAVNYNNEDPNPVIVDDTALIPCYTSASITMNIAPPPTVATAGNNQSVCSLTSNPLEGNSPISGTGLWTKKSGPGTVTFNDPSAPNTIATVDAIGTYVFTWSISNGQCTASTSDVTISFNSTPPPFANATQTFCKIDQPIVANLSATGTNVKWFTTPTGGIPLSSSDPLVSQIYYAEDTNATTLCKSVTRTAVDVKVNDQVAPTVDATQTFCQNGKIADLVASGTDIKWYLQPTGGTALAPTTDLISGTTYYASQTITTTTCESAVRAATLVTVNQTPDLTGSGVQTLCNSGTVANLIASGNSIQWYTTATGGTPVNTATPLVNGSTYYGTQTISGCESSNRYALKVTIIDPMIPISGGDQSVCESNPIQTILPSATVSDGGTITWYDAPIGGNLVNAPQLNSVGTITYYAQNNIENCKSSNRTPVQLEIKAAPLFTLTNKNCAPNLLSYSINFSTKSGTNITVSPNVGNLSANAITNIPAGTNITITASIPGGCNEVIEIIAPDCNCTPVANPISNGNLTICEGQNIPTLSVTVNANETADWYTSASGGSPLRTNSTTYTPSSLLPGNTIFFVEARNNTTNCVSTLRTPIILTLEGIPAPNGAASQSFCEIENPTIANLLATGHNIKWYPSLTSTIALNSTEPLTNTKYYATQTAPNGLGCESYSRLEVDVTVITIPAPTATATQYFCNQATVADLIANGDEIKWYDEAKNLLKSTDALLNGKNYYATQTLNGCESKLHQKVLVIIAQPTTPSINTSQVFCETDNATIATLTSKINNTNSVKWYLSPTDTNALLPTHALENNQTYYVASVVTSPILCESSPRIAVTVQINSPTAPDGPAVQVFCSSEKPTISNLSIINGSAIKWYDENNIELSSTTSLLNGNKYFASQSANGCDSKNRLEVKVVIITPTVPTTTAPIQLFCKDQNATLENINVTTVNPLSNIKWYDSATGGNVLASSTKLVNGTSYYAVEESINPKICESTNRLKIDVIIETVAAPTISTIESPTCAIPTGSVQLNGLPSSGNWTITSSDGSKIIGNGSTYKVENLSPGVSYNFTVKSANDCSSATSVDVIIPEMPLYPNLSIKQIVQPSCAVSSGFIEFNPQVGAEYSVGGPFQTSPTFENLKPGTYIPSIRNSNSKTCSISRAPIIINAPPKAVVFEVTSKCINNETVLSIVPIDNSFSSNDVTITWFNEDQKTVGTNMELNLSRIIGNINDAIYPLNFTATIKRNNTDCETTQAISLNSIFCGIQKGISPDGNGANEYFDLTNFEVNQLTIFNRYGVEVYSQNNYKKEWRGQSKDGNPLPDGTYYYTLQFGDNTTKTGWIYLNRKR